MEREGRKGKREEERKRKEGGEEGRGIEKEEKRKEVWREKGRDKIGDSGAQCDTVGDIQFLIASACVSTSSVFLLLLACTQSSKAW